MKRSLFLLFLVGFFSLSAEELSLERCLELARECNTSLEVAQLRTEQAVESKNEVRGMLFPSVSVEGVWDNRNDSLSGNLTQFQDFKATKAIGVSVRQHLFDFGASWMHFKASHERIEAARLAQEGTFLSVEEQVKNSFYMILGQQKVINVVEMGMSTLEKQLSQSKALFEQGVVKESDVLAVSVQLSEKKMRLSQEQNTLATQRMHLNRLIGLPLLETPQLIEHAPREELPSSFNDDVERALTHHKEYLALCKQIDALQSDTRASTLSHLPRFYAFGNGNYAAKHSTVSAGIGMSLPLYEGGSKRAQNNKLRAELRALKANKTEMEQHLAIEIKTAHLQLKELETNLAVSLEAIDLAKRTLSNYQELYKAGQITISEILHAEESLSQVKLGYVMNQYRQRMVRAHLNTLTGGCNET